MLYIERGVLLKIDAAALISLEQQAIGQARTEPAAESQTAKGSKGTTNRR